MSPRQAPRAADPRRLAVNFVLLSGGEFLAKLLTFAGFAYLARSLGPGEYGVLEFVLAVMVFFTLPADLGLGAYGAREIARNPARAPRLAQEIVQMRLLLAAASFVLLVAFVVLIRKPADVKLLLLLYGVSVLLSPALLQWLFQAHDLMHWVALASIIRQLVFAGLILGRFRPGSSILLVGYFEIASVAAVGGYCLAVAARMGLSFRPFPLRLRPLLVHLRQGLPIGLTELAWAFLWYFAIVLLGMIFADESLGWFGASHRALMALHTFVWLYFFNLLPSISRCASLPHQALLSLMRRSLRLTAWAGILVAFVMTALSRELLTLAYGPEFGGASHSFSLLVWMLPIAMLSGHHRFILIAYSQQNRLLYCTAIAGAVAVILGLTLVPLFGAVGASAALLAANAVNFALAYVAVKRSVVEVPFHPYLHKPLLALGVALAVFSLLREIHVWMAAGAAVGAYAAVLALSHGREMLALVRLAGKEPRRVEETVAG